MATQPDFPLLEEETVPPADGAPAASGDRRWLAEVLDALPDDSPHLAEIASLLASPSVDAFQRRRVEQLVVHGHTREADRKLPLDRLIRAARDRLTDALDRLGHDADRLPPAHADIILRKVEIAGALLFSGHEKLIVAIGDGAEGEGRKG